MTDLLPFQREDVRQIYRFGGRALVANDMGTGKTLEALYWLSKIPKHRPAIIICPASMKYTWQAEAHLHFGMHIDVLEGNCNGGTFLPGKIVVLNYDILGTWLPLLIKSKPKCVILDECQRIKSLKARRTHHAFKLCNEVSSVIGLSGTPLTNRPIELWPILKVICPDLFPSLRKFAWRYCAPRFLFGRWLFDGAKHTKELNQILLEHCMIRRRKKDVLPMLPNKGRKIVSFKLRSYKEYDEAKNEFLLWLRRLSPMRAKRAARAEALVKIGYLTRLVAKLKLDWTVKWIGDFFHSNPGEKLVAFTMHTAIIDALQEKFANRCVVVDGRVTGRKREESIRQFRSHRKKDLFLGNWMAAG
ncbi:MAG: hypothetical protein KGL39_45065, partial [Patescibacteria group bacterium]|nr:hypothetical protein [Patescibacteria group bacterium]